MIELPLFTIISVLRPAFNHSAGEDAEEEYDRLRDLARREAEKKKGCFDRVGIPFSCSFQGLITDLYVNYPGSRSLRKR